MLRRQELQRLCDWDLFSNCLCNKTFNKYLPVQLLFEQEIAKDFNVKRIPILQNYKISWIKSEILYSIDISPSLFNSPSWKSIVRNCILASVLCSKFKMLTIYLNRELNDDNSILIRNFRYRVNTIQFSFLWSMLNYNLRED